MTSVPPSTFITTTPLRSRPVQGLRWHGRPVHVTTSSLDLRLSTSMGLLLRLRVPTGTHTDFGSVPLTGEPTGWLTRRLYALRPLTWYRREFTYEGQLAAAFVLHDYGYKLGLPGMRLFWDTVLWTAMETKAGGKSFKPWKRRVIYWAVRGFGGRSYGRKMEGQR